MKCRVHAIAKYRPVLRSRWFFHVNLCPDQSALVEHKTRVKQNNRADEGGRGPKGA